MRTSHLPHFVIMLSVVLGGAILAPGQQTTVNSGAGSIVRLAPAESVFVLEVDSFEYTLSSVDQFLSGISPIPLGVQMLVRAKFAQVLGNPSLAGVNMNGTFGAFAMGPPEPVAPGEVRQVDPEQAGFMAILVPVTDYGQLIAGSPNCGEPDARGVSRLTVPDANMPMLVRQAGNYALVTQDLFYDKAVAIAEAVAARAASGGPQAGEVFEGAVAVSPIRLYVDIPAVAAEFGPAAARQMEQAKEMMAGTGGQQSSVLPPTMMNMDFSSGGGDVPVRSLAIGLDPKAAVLRASIDVEAVPDSNLATAFRPESPELMGVLAMVQARPPGQMGAELDSITAVLPTANTADFAGTFSLVDLMQMGAAMAPVEVPAISMQGKSRASYAVRADRARLMVDVALPKEHLGEVMTAAMTMSQQMGQGAMPQGNTGMDLPMPERVEVTEPVEPAPSRGPTRTAGGAMDIAESDTATDTAVRVVGTRLVRYADLDRGILPLGQGEGYTLALLAELPEPAVKAEGGTVETARTSTGKSLLPERSWQRRISFPRLSKDRQAVVFDVKLGLPDVDTQSIEEISGRLEYLVGSGSREVELGTMAMSAGSKGNALNAAVESIERDPYGNNATTVRLALDIPAEKLQSVRFLGGGGAVSAIPAGHITLGDRTNFRLSIKGTLPQQARVVVTVYESFRKVTVPFSIGPISLTGERRG
mgnify:CR=1 FL=1